MPSIDRIRIEAAHWPAMTPADIALVEEFNELDALRQAGQLPGEKETRWYILARAVDGIWYRASMASAHGLHDEPRALCP